MPDRLWFFELFGFFRQVFELVQDLSKLGSPADALGADVLFSLEQRVEPQWDGIVTRAKAISDESLREQALATINKLRACIDEEVARVEEYSPIDRCTRHLDYIIRHKEHLTGEHEKRVERYARIVAQHMNLDRQSSAQICRAARLHDIGKICISPEVWLDTDRWDDPKNKSHQEKKMRMQKHAEIGAYILSPSRVGIAIAASVRAHHENWDGTGYPDALADDSIPFWARIIRVADSFDAMTQSRGHRPVPLPCDQAIEELLAGQGKQYDPRICAAVDTCKSDLIAAFSAPLRAA